MQVSICVDLSQPYSETEKAEVGLKLLMVRICFMFLASDCQLAVSTWHCYVCYTTVALACGNVV
jgi:hypothetical protein